MLQHIGNSYALDVSWVTFLSPQGDIGACLTKYDATDKCFHVRKIYASHHLVKLSEGKLQHILSQVIRWSESLKVIKLDCSSVPCIHMNLSEAVPLEAGDSSQLCLWPSHKFLAELLSLSIPLKWYWTVNAALASLIVSCCPSQTSNHWRSQHLIWVQ